jgi:hypothetical protein
MSLLRKGTFHRPSLLKPAVSHLSPGNSILAPGQAKKASRSPVVAADPTPPGSPLHWFDLTDASVLFTDEAGTTNPTNGQEVLRCNNQGSSTEFISTTAEGPIYSTTGIPSISTNAACYFDDPASLGKGTTIEDIPTGTEHLSAAIVFARDRTTSLESMASWDEFALTFFNGGNTSTTSYVNVELSVAPTGQSAETFYAILMVANDEASPNHDVYSSYSATVAEGTHLLDGNVGAGESIVLGEDSVDEGNGFAGELAEWIVWDTNLSATEVADYKTYVTDKYGITWV